jgi:hypothetical protein
MQLSSSKLLILLLHLPLLQITSFTINNINNNIQNQQLIHTNMSNNVEKYLTPISPDQVKLEIKDPVDPIALSQAKDIISELRSSSSSSDGENIIASSILPSNLIDVAHRLNDIPKESQKYVVTKEECKAAYENLNDIERRALDNIHGRVKAFAEAQRRSVTDMEIDIPGGKAGHTVSPCKGTLHYFFICLL